MWTTLFKGPQPSCTLEPSPLDPYLTFRQNVNTCTYIPHSPSLHSDKDGGWEKPPINWTQSQRRGNETKNPGWVIKISIFLPDVQEAHYIN